MAQGVMANVAAPGACQTPKCEHRKIGSCCLTVSTALFHSYEMRVMEIIECEILIKELSCHESPGG